MATKVKLKTADKAAPKSSNLIAEVVKQVENLSADAAFKETTALIEAVDANYFKVGGLLSAIQANNYFTEKGYDNFKDCIEKEFGLAYRKAMYLIKIYNAIVAADVEWSKVAKIGWTKLKEIADILTKDNVDELVAKAAELTVLQLQEYVKTLMQGEGSVPTGEQGAKSDITTLTVKVHPEQKATIKEAMEKAKKEGNTDVDGVALEYVALSFVNTAGKAKPASLGDFKKLMAKAGYEKALEVFTGLWPSIDLKVEVPDDLALGEDGTEQKSEAAAA